MYVGKSGRSLTFYGLEDFKCDNSVLLLAVFQLDRAGEHFTMFYRRQHEGRKLTWLYNLSRVRAGQVGGAEESVCTYVHSSVVSVERVPLAQGEIVTNCFRNRYTLQVNIVRTVTVVSACGEETLC